MKTIQLPFILKLTLVLISVLCIGYLLVIGESIIAPFFLAFLLALLFRPFAKYLEQKLKFPRLLSTFSSVFIILIVIVGLSIFFSLQLSDFSNDLPDLKEQFETVFDDMQVWVENNIGINATKQFDYIDKGLDELMSSSGVILSFTVGMFSSSLGFLAFCLIFFIFILSYRRLLYNFLIHVFSNKHSGIVKQTVSEVEKMTKSYLIGVSIQVLIVTILTSVALAIFGVKYAILLGVLTGIINIIPYVGITLSGIIACFFAFATNSPVTALYVLISYIVIHTIDGNIILPFVIGSKVKINALFTFIGILIGASLWGISGMFLCIPALAIIKIITSKIDEVKAWSEVLGEGKS